MTAYFDEFAKKLNNLRVNAPGDWNGLEKLESRLVRDVSVMAESPGFPPDLREAIHKTILAHAVTCQPLLPDLRTRENPRRYDTDQWVYTELGMLESELHTIFHQLARLEAGFSDSPLQYVNSLAGSGEEYRERLAAAEIADGSKPSPESRYDHRIVDVCEQLHGLIRGTHDDPCADRDGLAAWLAWRLREWREPTSAYDASVRSLARATLAEVRKHAQNESGGGYANV